MRERNDSRYEQFEISPETIEQELCTVVCEQRQTDMFKENYNIDELFWYVMTERKTVVLFQKSNQVYLLTHTHVIHCITSDVTEEIL